MQRFQVVDRNGNPFQNPFDDNVSSYDSLETADDQTRLSHLEQLAHDNKPGPRQDGVAEANVFQPAEANHGIAEKLVFVGAVAADLSNRLKHDNARHEGHSGHVTTDPKLILGEVFVPDASNFNGIFVDDRRQLFHLETLRIVFANLIDVGQDVVEVDGIRIDDEFFCNQSRSSIKHEGEREACRRS